MLHQIYVQSLSTIVWASVLAIVVWAIAMRAVKKNHRRQALNGALVLVAVWAVFRLTVLGRVSGQPAMELRPLYSFSPERFNNETYRTMLMNAFLFLPLGITMPFALPEKWRVKRLLTVLFGLALSVGVEAIQYKYGLGLCETDDVLMNFAGVIAGTFCYGIYKFAAKRGANKMALTEVQKTVLNIVSEAVFAGKAPRTWDGIAWAEVYEEAVQQSVFLLVYARLEKAIPQQEAQKWKNTFHQLMAANMNVVFEHTEAHDLLTEHHIPYVILKGAASGAVYPSPMLRTYGDVDFLVIEADIDRVCALAETVGFTVEENRTGLHIALHRGHSTWELHRGVNGIPGGECGERINKYLADIIETAVEYETEEGSMHIPDTFHHGLVLLLHTASHLTSEGVGLRHLCDWVLFAASLTDDEFVSVFEQKLKACGLWRFAQLLTLCGTAYLNAPAREWAGTADKELLEGMVSDIMTGGNFGKKDADRYRQIKYISNRGERGVDNKPVLLQLWDTIGQKAAAEKKNRIAVIADYAMMVLCGQRKLDDRKTLAGAERRKGIYSAFRLFEQQK